MASQDRIYTDNATETQTTHVDIFSKTDTICTQSKTGVVAYLGGVHTVCVGTVIIYLCVTNITSNIHLNNVT